MIRILISAGAMSRGNQWQLVECRSPLPRPRSAHLQVNGSCGAGRIEMYKRPFAFQATLFELSSYVTCKFPLDNETRASHSIT